MIVTGFPRSGTTLLYCMLRYALEGWQFLGHESWEMRDGYIVKSVRALFETRVDPERCIAMIRDPRELLCSVFRVGQYQYKPFLSAHSCLKEKYRDRGICEWWAAIRDSGAHIVRYEELVAEPRRIQAALAERFGFAYRAGRHFDEFYREDHGKVWETALNGRRPLHHSRKIDAQRVAEEFAAHPELATVCADMGYPEVYDAAA